MRLSLPAYIAAAFALAACTAARPVQAPAVSAPDSAEIRLMEHRRIAQETLLNDWAGLSRYRAANDSIPPPAPGENRVVYIGDSITESWATYFPTHFPGKRYIARGISGQTTPHGSARA